MAQSWTCPFCNRPTTIVDDDVHGFSSWFRVENKHGVKKIVGQMVVCPNPECKEFTLDLYLYDSKIEYGNLAQGKLFKNFPLIPLSNAKVFPEYISPAIIKDYQEACLIRNLSPKASATLSRRCLQGIIRDFWKVRRKTLFKEIDAIKSKTDPLTWKAIDAVRKVGNIGAHMEKDIDLIIDVDPEEADKLIKLIETLLKEWYIHRYIREQEMQEVIKIAEEKKVAKKGLPESDELPEKLDADAI